RHSPAHRRLQPAALDVVPRRVPQQPCRRLARLYLPRNPERIMSQQSERAVLASILLAPDGILTARDQITPNVFRNPIHRDIYTAMVACAEDRSAPDIVNVTDELERAGNNEASTLVPAL